MKELDKLLNEEVLIPKLYSFNEVRELLEKQKQQYKKEFTNWFKNGTADIEDFIEEVFK